MMDEAMEDRGMITSQQALFDPDQKTRKCPSITTLKLFEGLKAYRVHVGRLRLFRPMLNMNRMSNSAKRACLPVNCNFSYNFI
ncbi:Branched-chain-amino-acid aminotransferase [Collichthys lucidus]|uniref:Branched-chain-amino-acid aminotransferase n=1 Tax=Collichthys lucidus TaxID=240159 RepID=A0A4U5VQV6_COLLU|nr:Branched-chain-amino-acid aminotransferase [Collichthys lucidus]